jgi:hypothetical protein
VDRARSWRHIIRGCIVGSLCVDVAGFFVVWLDMQSQTKGEVASAIWVWSVFASSALCLLLSVFAMTRLGDRKLGAAAIVVALAMLITIMPAVRYAGLEHARRTVGRDLEIEKLTGIYRAAYVYSIDHGGQFPPHAGSLIGVNHLTAKSFVSYFNKDQTPPRYIPGTDPGPVYRFGDWIFCYAGLGGEHAPSEAFFGFETRRRPGQIVEKPPVPVRYQPEIRQVVFMDGHASGMVNGDFDKLLAAENNRRVEVFHLPPIELDKIDGGR